LRFVGGRVAGRANQCLLDELSKLR
jgi:hypothetical protein